MMTDLSFPHTPQRGLAYMYGSRSVMWGLVVLGAVMAALSLGAIIWSLAAWHHGIRPQLHPLSAMPWPYWGLLAAAAGLCGVDVLMLLHLGVRRLCR